MSAYSFSALRFELCSPKFCAALVRQRDCNCYDYVHKNTNVHYLVLPLDQFNYPRSCWIGTHLYCWGDYLAHDPHTFQKASNVLSFESQLICEARFSLTKVDPSEVINISDDDGEGHKMIGWTGEEPVMPDFKDKAASLTPPTEA